ncbi:pyridoxal phosphate-dependent transferase [Mycena floridula]|nr:pyridoxal phosphate-dependent transferase [Mycena floridula]
MSPVVTPDDTVVLGLAVPALTSHAISVSLPKWRDNVAYEEGDKKLLDSMKSGYPRFFIHLNIGHLAGLCEQKFAARGERAMLFPALKTAEWCRAFMVDRSSKAGTPVHPRLVHFRIRPQDKASVLDVETLESSPVDLHIVLFPAENFSIAKEFWQHTGMGISSRLADHCLSMLPTNEPTSPTIGKLPNKHYANKSAPTSPKVPDSFTGDHNVYLEERYGRNLPVSAAASAKRALRRRIAGVLVRDSTEDCHGEPCVGDILLELGPSSRGIPEVAEHDVYLYPTGMTAIWSAHQLALAVRPPSKSICFGFPYTDTLKILQKWGPGCHFYGHGMDRDLDDLETLLEQQFTLDPKTPPILALFTEFPSNPLLRSANLPRIRALADKYHFLVVIDETIGNFMNVEILGFADIVVSSLTKIFSGSGNVMGGSLVLNPQGRYYADLKAHMNDNYTDFYFDQDAIFMERNSRDFQERSKLIDFNAETICDFLRSRSLAGGSPASVIKDVFYPKYITPENYDRCRIKGKGSTGDKGGGFGGLFSVTFKTLSASRAFFDTLSCYKGPSLGTNFTLACPFVVLAHFTELEWAAQYGVEEGLVRVSVGLEDTNRLLSIFKTALEAAESVGHAS